MSPFKVATTAIIIIIVLIYFGGVWTDMWYGPIALFKREWRLSDDFKEAVEIDDGPVTGPIYGPETVEDALMRMRATSPHLFRDDWYEEWRADFNDWVHRMRIERLRERVNMAYAT